MDIPRQWEQLNLNAVRGPVLVIGAPDVGKSTFARYLYGRLASAGRRVAYVDGDPGQSVLGPPTTLTAVLGETGDATFPPAGRLWRWFVGAVSPRGHMLSLVVGLARLTMATQSAGAEVVVCDTCGLVDPASGGVSLKLAKINLLRPATVFALQSHAELEGLLVPLRRSRRVRVVDVPPSKARTPRNWLSRQAHRAAQFQRYFEDGRDLTLRWRRLAVLPAPHFSPQRLVALEDAAGFALGLGFVQAYRPSAGEVTLHTPLPSAAQVDVLHLGDVLLDPVTFRDRPLAEK